MLTKPPHCRIALIAAVDEGGLIGKAGDLPWRAPVDMARFTRLCYADRRLGPGLGSKPVVLGRLTYDCIRRKYGQVLPGRHVMVLSRRADAGDCPDARWVGHDPQALLDAAAVAASPYFGEEIMVAGGAEVYKLFLPVADRVYLTTVDGLFSKGEPDEVYFPDWGRLGWESVFEERFRADPKTPGWPGHLFEVWVRKNKG